jgi:hypothetical protein
MDDRILNAHALAVEILGRVQRFVEFQKVSMETIVVDRATSLPTRSSMRRSTTAIGDGNQGILAS